MVILNQLEVGFCFKNGGRMYFYTEKTAVKLFINIISNTYFRINYYTAVLKIIRTGTSYFIEPPRFDVVFIELADKWCFFISAEKLGLCMPTLLAAWVILPSAAEMAF